MESASIYGDYIITESIFLLPLEFLLNDPYSCFFSLALVPHWIMIPEMKRILQQRIDWMLHSTCMFTPIATIAIDDWFVLAIIPPPHLHDVLSVFNYAWFYFDRIFLLCWWFVHLIIYRLFCRNTLSGWITQQKW